MSMLIAALDSALLSGLELSKAYDKNTFPYKEASSIDQVFPLRALPDNTVLKSLAANMYY